MVIAFQSERTTFTRWVLHAYTRTQIGSHAHIRIYTNVEARISASHTHLSRQFNYLVWRCNVWVYGTPARQKKGSNKKICIATLLSYPFFSLYSLFFLSNIHISSIFSTLFSKNSHSYSLFFPGNQSSPISLYFGCFPFHSPKLDKVLHFAFLSKIY